MRIFILTFLTLLAGCATGSLKTKSEIAPRTLAALKTVRVGMSEGQAFLIMEPVSLDWGLQTNRDTSSGEMIFQISATKQVKLSLERKGPDVSARTNPVYASTDDGSGFVVRSIGKPEPTWVVGNHSQVSIRTWSEDDVSREIAIQLMDLGRVRSGPFNRSRIPGNGSVRKEQNSWIARV